MPLSDHRSQLTSNDVDKPSQNWRMGSGSRIPPYPLVSHAEFVEKVVLPALYDACCRFGQAFVAEGIVKVTLPLYTLQRSDEVAAFLSCTLRGGQEGGNISRTVTNPLLAAKYGIGYVFGPISELGIVHQAEYVFGSNAKFFHYHACRMGEVIDNFSQKDYLAYIELCKFLLKNKVYDWSMEKSPEEWGMLAPCIRLYGLDAVMRPMAQALVDVAHLAGTKDWKYKYSLLGNTIDGLLPLMLPRMRKQGVQEIDKFLRPIVEFVLELSEEGAFHVEKASNSSIEGQFFFALAKDYLGDIEEKGIQQVLKEIRLPWLRKLTRS